MTAYVLARKEVWGVPNVVHTGTPNVFKGVEKSYGTASYSTLPASFAPGSNTWEVVIKFTTASTFQESGLMTKTHYGTPACNYGFRIGVSPDAQMYYLIGSGSNSYIWEGLGSHTLSPNTTYYVKFEFTGSVYNAYLSTNGKTWELDKTYTSSATMEVFNQPTFIGTNYYKGKYFNGSIDYNESYINIAGERWWTGIYNAPLPNVAKVGSPADYYYNTWGFSTSNYLNIPMSFQPASGDSWELGFKVKTGTLNTQQNILGIVPNERGGVEVVVTSSKWALWLSTGTSTSDYIARGATGSYTVLADTTYWVKVAYDGSTYTLSYSLDGETYVEDISVSSTAAIYANTQYCLGANGYSGSAGVWTGHIFLDGCYAKINGKIIWKGIKPNDYIKGYVLKRKINKYYKDIVTTKYWKEVETTVKGVTAACYSGYSTSGYIIPIYLYAKMPLGSDMTVYTADGGNGFYYAEETTTVSDLTNYMITSNFTSLTEDAAGHNINGLGAITRMSEHDIYGEKIITQVVEGSADDYTYTTTETTTVAGTPEDYDRVEVDSDKAYFWARPNEGEEI